MKCNELLKFKQKIAKDAKNCKVLKMTQKFYKVLKMKLFNLHWGRSLITFAF